VHGGLATGQGIHESAIRSGGRGVASALLAIDPSEALFSTRGFPETRAKPRLESAAQAFISGYNFALAATDAGAILDHIGMRIPSERGFVAEGAAMAAAIRTALVPWKDRLGPVLELLSDRYPHLAHVGVGWAIARAPFAKLLLFRRLDPRLLPLAIDGRGFHDGYFYGLDHASRRRPGGRWGRIYDQGLGRSLWFICGADPRRLLQAVAGRETARRDDLWAGIGLAAAYAGGADPVALAQLRHGSGGSLSWLKQGASFAVSAHARAGKVPDESAAAAAVLCERDPAALIELVEREYTRVRSGPQPAAYEEWRRRVAISLDPSGVGSTA
jgi:hypothetical protein